MDPIARARRLWIGLLLLPLGVAAAAADPQADAAEQTTLRLASDVWPPFTDHAGSVRFAIDLVHAALQRGQVAASSEIREDFAKLMQELRDGGIEGSAALWRDPERERFLVFSRPYLENRLVLLARKGTDVSATDLAGLVGKRIAIVESYAYGDTVEKASGPVFVPGPSDQDNLDRLMQREVDYMLADELLIHALFERYGGRAEGVFAVGEAPIVARSLHFALRRDHPGADAIVKRFDESILEMLADGSYNRILGVNWIRADVDGDGKPELVLGGKQAGTSEPSGAYPVLRPRTSDAPAGSDGYVIEGKKYPNWTQVPSQYQVPAQRELEGPEPGIKVLRF